MSNHSDHNHDADFDGFSLDEIKKNFSALAEELEEGGEPIGRIINESQETLEDQDKKETPPPFYRGYNPTIKDFLARASTVEECEEIIDYCLKQEEITDEEAEQLYNRLKRGGPRAFGTRRPGYYDQQL